MTSATLPDFANGTSSAVAMSSFRRRDSVTSTGCGSPGMRKPSEPLGGTCSMSRPSRLTTSASSSVSPSRLREVRERHRQEEGIGDLPVGLGLGLGLRLDDARHRDGRAALRPGHDPDHVRRLEPKLGCRRDRQRQVEVAAAVRRRRARAVDPELDVLGFELGRSPRRVDPEIQPLVVAAVEDALDDAGRAVQGAEARADQVVAGVAPRRVLDRRRADADRGHAALGRAGPLDDRLEQACRRAAAPSACRRCADAAGTGCPRSGPCPSRACG